MGPATIVTRSTRTIDDLLPGLSPAGQGFGAPRAMGLGAAPNDARSAAASPLLLGRVVVNSIAIFVVTIVAGLTMLAAGPRLLGYQNVVVGSSSMAPSLRAADIVVLAPPALEQIHVGTVINYRVADSQRIHRVVEVTPAGYRTKGDANAAADSEVVRSQDVTGIGIYVVPVVGLARFWFENGRWFELGLALSMLVGSVYASRRRFVEIPLDGGVNVDGETPVRRRRRPLSP